VLEDLFGHPELPELATPDNTMLVRCKRPDDLFRFHTVSVRDDAPEFKALAFGAEICPSGGP
jgi:hypothetical protein